MDTILSHKRDSAYSILRGYDSIVLGTSGIVCQNVTVIQKIVTVNVDRFLPEQFLVNN